MRVIGIEIFGKEVRYVVLDDTGGQIKDITESYKRPILEDDDDSQAVKMFRNVLFATFDRYQPDRIIFKWRNSRSTKTFQQEDDLLPSPMSFKIEGLIQTYDSLMVTVVPPQRISAFLKDSPLPLTPAYEYQTEAMRVAYYGLKARG
jgi:hypothetical protein